MNLKYPKAFIVDCRNKAERIRARGRRDTEEKTKEHVIVIPRSRHSETISRAVRRSGVRVMEKSGQKIGQLVKMKKAGEGRRDSVVYKIPCNGCSMSYFGETSRGLKKRITEHKRDLRNHNGNSSLVKHLESCPHLPDWENAETLKVNLSKPARKILESSLIEALPCSNTKAGDIKVAKSVAIILLDEYLGMKVT